MTVLVTPDEMQSAEQAVIAAGTPAAELMRRAAEAIAEWVDTHVPATNRSTRDVLAFVGPGNNGGDTLVTLALLHERGWTTRAVMLRREELGQLPAADDSLRAIAHVPLSAVGTPNVILDGVFGFRSRVTLPAEIRDAFAVARESRLRHSTPLIAIDVPSGIDAQTGEADPNAFPADVTLCLGLPKIGFVQQPAAEYVGELELIPIGIDEPDVPEDRPRLITEQIARSLIPRRPLFAHKHDTGSTIVVGGASTYYGAPRLAAEAAMRAGAGLVHAAVPKAIVSVLAAQVPEAVIAPLDDSDGRTAAESIASLLSPRGVERRAVVIGPGLGRAERARDLLDAFFSYLARLAPQDQPSVVIDADALNWISSREMMPEGIEDRRAILTPHAGELARLLKCNRADIEAAPLDAAREAATRYRQIVFLKRGYSIVTTPDGRAWYAPRATPEMATAGTGDVLAGLLGGLLAQGLATDEAAIFGALVGTSAGKMARQKRGTVGVVARDVIDRIPAAIASVSEPRLSQSWY